MDGHLAPTFYLIGAQKAGTSTFARDLGHSKQIVKPWVLKGEREYYFKELHAYGEDGNYEMGKQHWLNHFPKCHNLDKATHFVAWDCTPNYLTWPQVPSQIRDRYGEDSWRLQFAVMLREPIARMHSAYYHFLSHGNQTGFDRYLDNLLDAPEEKLMWYNTPFTYGLYATYLQRWFEQFDSSQFFILPYHLYTSSKESAQEVLERVMHKLHVKGSEAHGGKVNSHNHIKLEKDVKPEKLNRLREMTYRRGGDPAKIAEVLSRSKAELYGFQGERHDKEAILQWLTKNW